MKILFCSRFLSLVLALSLFSNEAVIAGISSDTLAVGKPFPATMFRNILHYNTRSVNSKKMEGKWLILDFWSRGCSACVERFPVMNALQNKHFQNLQVFLVGKRDSHISEMYEKFRQKESLTLPVIFDTLLFSKFKIKTVPYIIIIDPKGITRAITIGLTEEDFLDFLNGKTPVLTSAKNSEQERNLDKTFDAKSPLFIAGNGGPDTSFYFRSVLGPWSEAMPTMAGDFPEISGNRFQLTGVGISELYAIAYCDTLTTIPFKEPNAYGKYWPFPILEVKDTSLFQMNFSTGKNIFSYSQTAPQNLANKEQFRARMQRDLQSYFGYRVRIENQIKPCWEIIALSDSSKNFGPSMEYIKTEENDQYLGPLKYLPAAIWYHNQQLGLFFDHSGISGNVGIELDVIMSDISELNKGLRKYGLALQMGQRDMKVIILSDY